MCSRKPGQLGREPLNAARAFDEATDCLWRRFDDFDLTATAARSRYRVRSMPLPEIIAHVVHQQSHGTEHVILAM
jgi:hypothetical protein